MAESVLVDAGFIVALLSRRDTHHRWAVARAERFPPPWRTCESVVSEAVHLIGTGGLSSLSALLRRQSIVVNFDLGGNLEAVVKFMNKYRDVPASLADSALVRMTETIANPVLLTTDSDFHIYRRHSRLTVPCVSP